ncbi:MAG: DUF4430 domain-containing protein [Planctomycetales bacterium]|nr:DUF4430 domain-containing protein [Planctomycetales bacterium]
MRRDFQVLTILAPTVVVFAISVGCESTPPPPVAGAPVGVVTLEFNSDGTSTSVQVPGVADGATLESVMRSVDQIAIELSGSGTTAFVQSIGNTKMEADKGWTFKVDGEFANQGIGQTVLHPPTTVQWTYGEFQM